MDTRTVTLTACAAFAGCQRRMIITMNMLIVPATLQIIEQGLIWIYSSLHGRRRIRCDGS